MSLHAADDQCNAINALLADSNVYVVPQTPSIRMMCTAQHDKPKSVHWYMASCVIMLEVD